MNQTTDTTTPALLCGEAGYDLMNPLIFIRL